MFSEALGCLDMNYLLSQIIEIHLIPIKHFLSFYARSYFDHELADLTD